jgi:hypothetical protein
LQRLAHASKQARGVDLRDGGSGGRELLAEAGTLHELPDARRGDELVVLDEDVAAE